MTVNELRGRLQNINGALDVQIITEIEIRKYQHDSSGSRLQIQDSLRDIATAKTGCILIGERFDEDIK